MTTWIKLHDNFWENPKVLAAGEDAALLYIQGLSYCSRNLTDGAIPTPALRNLTARKEARTLAKVLVREGLWLETATGWRVHDYLKVQRSKEQVEAEREKARERQRKSRSGHAVTSPVTDGVTHGDVTPPDTEADTDTKQQQQATTPEARKAVLKAAAEIIGERAAARPSAENPVAVAKGVARAVERDRYQDAYRLLAADPDLTAQELADLLEPPEPPRPLIVDSQLQAQQVIAERNHLRLAGGACPRCDAAGWYLDETNTAIRCDCAQDGAA